MLLNRTSEPKREKVSGCWAESHDNHANILFFTKCYQGYHTKTGKDVPNMGRTRNAQMSVLKSKLTTPGVARMVILKLILQKLDV